MAPGDMMTLRRDMRSRIERAVKELLEKKHLYQSVTVVNVQEFVDDGMPAGPIPDIKAEQRFREYSAITAARHWLFVMAANPWIPEQSDSEGRHRRAEQTSTSASVVFEFPSVRLYCRTCKNREPYNVAAVHDAFVPAAASRQGNETEAAPQLLIALLQCQGCKSFPEFVAIARKDMKLSFVGRYPMETIEVPDYLPREESDFVRDARIAFNTGNVLAGLFYLRIFIEQFARRVTKTTGRKRGDVLMDEYGETIPPELRSRIPSLREWYDKLSEKLHAAEPDETLYVAAETEILHHFEIRRAMRLN
jgi:hypothetical protein